MELAARAEAAAVILSFPPHLGFHGNLVSRDTPLLDKTALSDTIDSIILRPLLDLRIVDYAGMELSWKHMSNLHVSGMFFPPSPASLAFAIVNTPAGFQLAVLINTSS